MYTRYQNLVQTFTPSTVIVLLVSFDTGQKAEMKQCGGKANLLLLFIIYY